MTLSLQPSPFDRKVVTFHGVRAAVLVLLLALSWLYVALVLTSPWRSTGFDHQPLSGILLACALGGNLAVSRAPGEESHTSSEFLSRLFWAGEFFLSVTILLQIWAHFFNP